jgi:ATP-dependent DNA helicase 2 subunit 2
MWKSRCSKLTIRQVATGRKSALMGVIGCRTDETDLGGVMEETEGYENLHVFSELKQ